MISCVICSVFLCYFVPTAECTRPVINSIYVPTYSFSGNRINVSCSYTIGKDRSLYSLKWYHNDVEFYRHFSSEGTLTKDPLQFNVIETDRTPNKVTLELTGLTTDASGEYKCEVLDEFPYFTTEEAAKNMTVLDEAPRSPVISGLRDSYDRSDTVRLVCHPQVSRRIIKQEYVIRWYIDGTPAPSKYSTAVNLTKIVGFASVKGLLLNAKVYELIGNGNSASVNCTMSVNELGIKVFRSAQIKLQPENKFLATFFSSKDCHISPLPSLLASMSTIIAIIKLSYNKY